MLNGHKAETGESRSFPALSFLIGWFCEYKKILRFSLFESLVGVQNVRFFVRDVFSWRGTN